MTIYTRAATHTAGWQRAEEEDALWGAHGSEFQRCYPDQYVAVNGGVVVATAADLPALVATLAAQRIDPADTWVRFFSSGPGTLIL
jgi:hypothetical protein